MSNENNEGMGFIFWLIRHWLLVIFIGALLPMVVFVGVILHDWSVTKNQMYKITYSQLSCEQLELELQYELEKINSRIIPDYKRHNVIIDLLKEC